MSGSASQKGDLSATSFLVDPVCHAYAYDVRMWTVNGFKHRLDGPAVLDPRAGGSQEWWVAGHRHRLDGPAVTRVGGEEWWVDGARHRLDGPALTGEDGAERWWVRYLPVTDPQPLEDLLEAGEQVLLTTVLTAWTPRDDLPTLIAAARAAHG